MRWPCQIGRTVFERTFTIVLFFFAKTRSKSWPKTRRTCAIESRRGKFPGSDIVGSQQNLIALDKKQAVRNCETGLDSLCTSWAGREVVWMSAGRFSFNQNELDPEI